MNKSRKYELIQELSDIVAELGWNIAIQDDEELVDGLIIGTEEYILNVLNNPTYGMVDLGGVGDVFEILEFDENSEKAKKKRFN